jgi:hypothetical protein
MDDFMAFVPIFSRSRVVNSYSIDNILELRRFT